MSVRTDRVNLIVNVSGDAAKKQMNDLTKRAAELRSEMKGLKKSSAEYINKSKELSAVKGQMDNLRRAMDVTKLSQKELTAELRKLKALRNVATPQTKEYFELQKQIEKVEKRLRQVRTGTFGFKSALAGLKTEVKQFGVLAASYLGFEFISGQFRNIIRGTGELSDQLADIRKTAGLTEPEVKQLNAELSKIGTRTSLKNLREIVKVLGQMGFAKEDLLGSAQAIDKIVVALGDEFDGGAEQITNVLGKLRNSLVDLKTEDSAADLLAIGNALNVLGSEGIATAPVVSDFTQRLSGAGSALGLSSGQIFGLSAAMEEMGISAEVGGTATIKILNKLAKSPEKFADIAGKSVREFSNIVNTDMSQALLLVAKGFNNSQGKATEFAERLGDAEISGARVLEVMSKLGSNTELASEKINVASEALLGTQSIMDEFAIKNENFAATLDKLSKEFNKLVFSPAVQGFLVSAVEGALRFVKGLKDIPQWLERNRTLIILVATATAFYTRAKIAQIIATNKLRIALAAQWAQEKLIIQTMVLGVRARRAMVLITEVFTGKVKVATAVSRIFNATTKSLAGIVGIAIVVLGAITAIWSSMSRKVKATAASVKDWNKVMKEATANAGKEIGAMQKLFNSITNVNKSNKQRTDEYKKLQAMYPNILGNLSAEKALASDLKDEYNELVDAIVAKYVVQASETQFGDLGKELLKVRQGIQAVEETLEKNRNNANLDSGYTADGIKRQLEQQKKILQAQEQGIKNRFAKLQKLTDDLRSKYSIGQVEDTNTADYQSSNTDGKKKKPKKGKTEAERKLEREAKALEAFRKKVANIEEQAQVAALNKDEAEIQRVINKYARLLKEADKFSKNLVAKEVKSLNESQKKELELLNKKHTVQRSAEHYKTTKKTLEKFLQEEKNLISERYASGEISEKQFQEKIIQLEARHINDRIAIAQNYAKQVPQAAEDAEKAKTEKLKQGIKDRQVLEETEIEERLAKAQRQVLNTTPGTEANRKAQRNLANEEFLLDTEGLDEASEQFKLRYAQHKAELEEIDFNHLDRVMREVDKWKNYVNDIYSSLSKIASNNEKKELQILEKTTAEKKKQYDQDLKNKLYSRQKYDDKVAALDKNLAQKKLDAQIKAAKREQRIGIFNASIDTAQAAARALSEYQYPYSLIIAGLAVASGAAQIAAIKSEPLPVGRKGLVLNGPSHEQGGINMVDNRTGKPIAEVEGGEAVMVFSKDTYANNKPVLDQLMYASNYQGGRSIAWMQNRPQINIDKAIPAMAKGGYVSSATIAEQFSKPSSTTQPDNDLAELIKMYMKKQDELNQTMAKMPTTLKAQVVHKEIREINQEYQDAKKEVSL